MTPTVCCGMECGVFGTVAQGHWAIQSGTPVYDTAIVRSGLRALRCVATGTAVYALSGALHATRGIARFYMRFNTSLPSGDTFIFAEGGLLNGVWFQASDSSLYNKANGTLGTEGYPVIPDRWYLLDVLIDRQTAASAVKSMVNGPGGGGGGSGILPPTNADNPVKGSTNSAYALGVCGAVTADISFDDYLQSSAVLDYPIGPGFVLSLVPNYDGTHTCTGSNIDYGTAANPTLAVVSAATTDVYEYLNARPLGGGQTDATRLVNQRLIAATEYVEVGFEECSVAPRAVEVITADQEATTAVGNFAVKMNDNGVEDTVIQRGAEAGSVTDRYANKHYPTMVGGGDWTLARFNALTARFGYSSDATPDQYWRGIMLEVEFPASLDPAFVTNMIFTTNSG